MGPRRLSHWLHWKRIRTCLCGLVCRRGIWIGLPLIPPHMRPVGQPWLPQLLAKSRELGPASATPQKLVRAALGEGSVLGEGRQAAEEERVGPEVAQFGAELIGGADVRVPLPGVRGAMFEVGEAGQDGGRGLLAPTGEAGKAVGRVADERQVVRNGGC